MKTEANERSWQLRAAGFPHTSKKGQQETISELNAIGAVGRNRKKPWEVVDQDSAITIIGLDIKIHGMKWLDKHPDEKAMLQRSGVSPEEAIELHEKWQRELFESKGRGPGGQPNKNRKSSDMGIVTKIRGIGSILGKSRGG